MAKFKQETVGNGSKKKKEPFKCEKRRPRKSLADGIRDKLVSRGIISNDPNCRFSWLVPWVMGTKRECCPKKNGLPKVNPLETRCEYKPLFKTGQIWVWLIRGATVPQDARAKPCIGKPCRWWNR
uniref:DNA primase n=1 Tax=Lygus hesperus TaxID=30085 RepID=A0A0A9YNY1_LYGHE